MRRSPLGQEHSSNMRDEMEYGKERLYPIPVQQYNQMLQDNSLQSASQFEDYVRRNFQNSQGGQQDALD